MGDSACEQLTPIIAGVVGSYCVGAYSDDDGCTNIVFTSLPSGPDLVPHLSVVVFWIIL